MLYIYLLFLLGLFSKEILYIINNISLKFIIKNNIFNYFYNKIYCYNLNHIFAPRLSILGNGWNLLKLIIKINIIIGLLTIFYWVLILDISLIDNIIIKGEYINPDNNVNNNEINVNNPNLTLNTPTIGTVNLKVPGVIPAVIGGASIRAGMEVAKHVPSIGGKIAVTAATAGFVAATASFGAKIGTNTAEQMSNSTTTTNSISNNLLPNFESYISIPKLDEHLLGHVEGLDKYPLNLLVDMFTINLSLLAFLFLILNVFIAIYLKNKDVASYLSQTLNFNNKLSNIIIFLYNRYINIWYESRMFILIFSWCMLFIGHLIFMLGFYIILNSG
jgi:hypothetical protein